MSKEEKMQKKIMEEISKKTYNNKEDLQQVLNNINENLFLNNFDFDDENNDEYRSDDILEQAREAVSKKQAKELAKKALIIYPDNIDAMCYLANFENTLEKKLYKYNKAINRAEEILNKKNLFGDDSIGYFWGMMETRPYMRARCGKVEILLELKKYEEAMLEVEDILRLNRQDNLDMRYTLMNLYCLMNKYDELNSLFAKFQEISTHVLFTKCVMYFKQNNMTELKKSLKDLKSSNKYIIDLLIGKIRCPIKYSEYYTLGSIEEAALVIEDGYYLIENNVQFIEYLHKEFENA